jgi:hypothetical protein
MACPHCGQQHPVGSVFCSNTGRPFAAGPPVTPAQQQPPPYIPPPPQQMVQGYAPPPPPLVYPAASGPLPGVRHAYPLAIGEATFGTAFGLMMKTLPYALARLGVLLAVSIATLIFVCVALGGWAFLAARVHPVLGFVFFIVCCAAYGWLWMTIVRYFLYLLKCGHIVCLTDLVTQGRIDDGGKGMFAYGKDVVRSRFGEATALFAVDALVKGVVRAFNRTLDFIANLLPFPGLESLVRLVNAIVYAATTYVDETIFSYGLARRETDPWASAKDGLVYYAQNAKPILKTGVYIVILDKILSFVIWLVMLAPAFAVAALVPSSVGGTGFWIAFGFAVLLAANMRSAFLKPLFLVMIMTKFHVLVQNQPINVEWEQRLASVSDKFRGLLDKVFNSGRGGAAAPPS